MQAQQTMMPRQMQHRQGAEDRGNRCKPSFCGNYASACGCCYHGGQQQPQQHQQPWGVGCGAGPACGCGCGGLAPPLSTTYSADEWADYRQTTDGQTCYRWWADWIPTLEGQTWCNNKRLEARCVVDGMIHQWGLETLRSGMGVIDVGGDPGFLAAELLRSGIHVTVVDPAFGMAGKTNPATLEFLQDPCHEQNVVKGAVPFSVIQRPFDQAFMQDHSMSGLLHQASAVVSLYPDEATQFVLYFSAATCKRLAIIPCNECQQYFPPHEPTYEGFVKQLLRTDSDYTNYFGHGSYLQQVCMNNTPFCRVLLQRTPAFAQSRHSGPSGRH